MTRNASSRELRLIIIKYDTPQNVASYRPQHKPRYLVQAGQIVQTEDHICENLFPEVSVANITGPWAQKLNPRLEQHLRTMTPIEQSGIDFALVKRAGLFHNRQRINVKCPLEKKEQGGAFAVDPGLSCRSVAGLAAKEQVVSATSAPGDGSSRTTRDGRIGVTARRQRKKVKPVKAWPFFFWPI